MRGPVPGHVPVPQVARHIGEPEPGQRGPPPGVQPGAPACVRQRGGGRRGDLAQVPGQPVLVQPGRPADGSQAGPLGRAGQHQRADVRVTVPPCRLRGHAGQVQAAPLSVGPGHRGRGHRRQRLAGLAPPLLGMGAAGRGRGRIAGQVAGPGPLPPCRAAPADRRVEDEPRGEGGGPQLAGFRALQRLAALQAERVAVGGLGPAVHPQVRRDGAERPAAQVADHLRSGRHHLAGRREERRAIGEHAQGRRAGLAGPGSTASGGTARRGHDRPSWSDRLVTTRLPKRAPAVTIARGCRPGLLRSDHERGGSPG